MNSIDVVLVRSYLEHVCNTNTDGYELQFRFEGATVLVVQICEDSGNTIKRSKTKEFRILNTEYIRWKKVMGGSGKLKKLLKNG